MRIRGILLSALVAVPAGHAVFGGWAVVTIENPPERLTVGAPYTIEYSVRQHGNELFFVPLACLRGQQQPRTDNTPHNGNGPFFVNQQSDSPPNAELRAGGGESGRDGAGVRVA